MLTDKHSNAYSRHVETVQETLYVGIYLHSLFLSLVFIDTLRDCSYHRIVSPFDVVQHSRELLVVFCELGWPAFFVINSSEIPLTVQ